MIFSQPSFDVGPELSSQLPQFCDLLFRHRPCGFISSAIAFLAERIEPPDNFRVKHKRKCQRFDRNGMMPRNVAVRAVACCVQGDRRQGKRGAVCCMQPAVRAQSGDPAIGEIAVGEREQLS